MAGLARILKSCGEMTIQSGNESSAWVWDSVNDKAVIKSKKVKPKQLKNE